LLTRLVSGCKFLLSAVGYSQSHNSRPLLFEMNEPNTFSRFFAVAAIREPTY
jgi:hypothetical protein